VTFVTLRSRGLVVPASASITSPMLSNLTTVRRAQTLLTTTQPLDGIVEDLRRSFDIDFIDAMASVAAGVLLLRAGLLHEEQMVRPYMR
jgi:hypothetical protein